MTIADLIRRNGTDPAVAPRPFLGFGEREISHAEFYAESIRFARLFLAIRDPAAPFHVGVLMDNVPEYLLAFGGAALAGAVVVGINSTQRGAARARGLPDSLDRAVAPATPRADPRRSSPPLALAHLALATV